MNNLHLGVHGLTVRQYLDRHPTAALYSDESRNKLATSQKKRLGDPEARARVSRGTILGMHKPESWKKFTEHIASRDVSGENNSFFGKHHTDEVKKEISENKERAAKISQKKKEWWVQHEGKTVEEIFGAEIGARMRLLKSERMTGEKNPAFGKIYTNAGGKIGRYKGQFFRSTWEASFYIFLESSGIDIVSREEVVYESLSIPYEVNGKKKTYHPDFLLSSQKKLIEVKSLNELSRDDRKDVLSLKFAAARKFCDLNGLEFIVMTEADFPVVPFSKLKKDQNIEWIRA